jgi:hypothetical protein
MRITFHGMIHPFYLQDIPLLTRLGNGGTSLCNELALTHGQHPLRSALTGYFSLYRRGVHTCVTSEQEGHEGFAQMRPQGERGVMTCIAPLLSGGDAAATWGHLLDAMAEMAGRLGLQQLVAEAPDEGAELETLRRAGFSVYLRQDILRLASPGAEPAAGSLSLREATPLDAWAIQQLYYNITPRLAQLAEAMPPHWRSGVAREYVLVEDGELTAHLEIQCGSKGAWFNVMIHPEAETCARQVLAQGLALLGKPWDKPVYGCVRRYQEWLRDPLMALGFEPFISSTVLVKRLVVPVVEPALSPALEAQAKFTSPAVRSATSDK